MKNRRGGYYPPVTGWMKLFSERSRPFPTVKRKQKSTLAGAFLNAIFKFCFSVRKEFKFRKFRKKFRGPLRIFDEKELFLFRKLLYPLFQLSCAGFAFGFPKGDKGFDLMAFGIFRGGFKPVIMNVNSSLYIVGETGVERIILAEKGIYPEHQISRTARTLLSSLGSPTTKPAFLKSLFALPLSREYAAQSFFASPRGISFTILIAS